MSTQEPAGNGAAPGPRDPEEVRRHEAHLVGQIYHLIEQNQRLEEQVDRLSRVTEIADIFRNKRISIETFELPPPQLDQPAHVVAAWRQIEQILAELPDDFARKSELTDQLGMVRAAGSQVDPDWLADARLRLVAAEQANAYLEEQSRELDLLRNEKDSIMDGVEGLEQTIEDLWKALNEKTTHIQRLEQQLSRIWGSVPYRVFKAALKPFRRGGKS